MEPTHPHVGPAVVRVLARWSDGIRLCVTDGPASGRMMAYAIGNRPAGRGIVGRWVDRRFLAFPGWAGVRERYHVARGLLGAALNTPPAHVLDLGGGTSAALLDELATRHDPGVTAACVDLDPAALAAGRTRAAELGLVGVRFDVADALDGPALLARTPRPDVILCTGLYELLADDAAVRRSIDTVAALLPPGGRFVVGHQTTVPPVGRLGRWLTDAAPGGRPRLTPRSADTLANWLAAAGFTVERTADAAGLYVIVLARRV